MGQQDILKLMRKNPKRWYSRKELNIVLGTSSSKLQGMGRCLKVLHKNSEIEMKITRVKYYNVPVYRLKEN